MSILTKIINFKKYEIAALDSRALRRAAEASPTPEDFAAALRERRYGDKPSLIAELKRASPSKGIFAPHIDLLQAAIIYVANGAAAISVLTDKNFFMGSLDTLRFLGEIQDIGLPLMRKDFIIDEAQLYEARAYGADAVLLITAALPDDARLADLHALTLELGLTPMVEVRSQDEVERALNLENIRLIGINNRNLDTFLVTLETTENLRPLIPAEIPVVAESGIFTAADVARLARAGVDAVLVGEALITAPDMAAKVRELSGMTIYMPERWLS